MQQQQHQQHQQQQPGSCCVWLRTGGEVGAGASGSELAGLAGAGPELAGLAQLVRSSTIERGRFGAGGAGASGSDW